MSAAMSPSSFCAADLPAVACQCFVQNRASKSVALLFFSFLTNVHVTVTDHAIFKSLVVYSNAILNLKKKKILSS